MSRHPQYKFRLYVAGDASNSRQALANLKALCSEHLPGQHEIEVVDVLRRPGVALAERVLMTPTLERIAPSPKLKIVGTLSQIDTVLMALGLEYTAA